MVHTPKLSLVYNTYIFIFYTHACINANNYNDNNSFIYAGDILELKGNIWHVQKGYPTLVAQVQTDKSISDNRFKQVIQFGHPFMAFFFFFYSSLFPVKEFEDT